MTVEERRAVREALAGDWCFSLHGLRLSCAPCLANEWMDGAAVVLMNPAEDERGKHFRCPECGYKEYSDFLLWDFGRDIPGSKSAWN